MGDVSVGDAAVGDVAFGTNGEVDVSVGNVVVSTVAVESAVRLSCESCCEWSCFKCCCCGCRRDGTQFSFNVKETGKYEENDPASGGRIARFVSALFHLVRSNGGNVS